MQILKPNGSSGGEDLDIFPSEGGDPTRHEACDDGVGGDDTTGIEQSGVIITSDTVVFTLDNPTGEPNKTVNWTLRTRTRYVDGAPDTLIVKVMEGASTRATHTLTGIVTSSWATYELSWDPSAVVDADDLDISVQMSENLNTIQVADVELEIDDSPVSSERSRGLAVTWM